MERSQKGSRLVPEKSQKDPRKVPEKSQKGPRKVSERSQKGLRKVPQRSHKGPTKVSERFQSLKAPPLPNFQTYLRSCFRSSCAPFAFILLLLSFFFTYSYIRPSTYNWNIKSSCHYLLPLAISRLYCMLAGYALPSCPTVDPA